MLNALKYIHRKEDVEIEILCNSCRFYISGDTCKAFPNGIPRDILFGEFDHTKKYPDQNNDIVFEPVERETQNA